MDNPAGLFLSISPELYKFIPFNKVNIPIYIDNKSKLNEMYLRLLACIFICVLKNNTEVVIKRTLNAFEPLNSIMNSCAFC